MTAATLQRKANEGFATEAHTIRTAAESAGAYVKGIEFQGMRCKVYTMHPERALEGIRAAGYADWCGTEYIGCDRVDVVCVDPCRYLA